MSSFKFCGTPIWDHSLTVNTTNPDLTQCFQRTILQWVPCFFLALITPMYLRRLTRSSQAYIPWNWLNFTKMVLCGVIGVLMLVEVGQGITELTQGVDIVPENFITPLVIMVTMIICVFIIYTERLHGIRASGWLAVFWTMLAIFGVITFRSHIRTIVFAEEEDLTVDILRIVVFYLYYVIVFVQFILFMFLVDKPPVSWIPTGKNPNPELHASIASRMTFWWITSIIVLGFKRPLQQEDLFSLNDRDTAARVYPHLEQNLDDEFRRLRCGRYKEKNCRSRYSKADHEMTDGETLPLKSDGVHPGANPEVKVEDGKPAPTPSFVRVLCYTYYTTFIASFGYKILHDIFLFINPQLLRYTIKFISDMTQPMWQGYVFAAAMFIVTNAQTLFLGQYFYHCMTMGMRARCAIVAAVYRKAMKLSNSARKTSTVGEIVNLMSVDSQKFFEMMPYLHMLWSAPFQIAVCLFFLWQTLGPSVLAGLGVMILLIPLNAVTASKVKQYQTDQMKLKDDRIKLINEVLNGIKVLKLYAWENSFEERVLNVRKNELRLLKHAAYLNAVVSFTWMLAPYLVSLTTFAVFVLVDEKNVLDAEKAFVSLALFNILRFPVSMLPQLIGVLVQVSVSVKRIQKFLNNDELDTDIVSHNTDAVDAINIDNGTFSWDKDSDPVLNNLNVSIAKGSLVAVVGRVGAGKTSMISAVLGEMEKLSGSVNINGSVAYVAQQAWIQNATVRENILFSQPMCDDKFDCVVEACALKPDLEILQAGDQTEIGEKGINLSGGQKQRVSLARAVYSDSDIYLMDDPLSAVDSHVGKHIFDKVIGPCGMLAKKTRVIVTHSIRFLSSCDHIIVMVDGQVSEQGSYKQLISSNLAFAEFLKNYIIEGSEEDDIDDEDDEVKEEILSHLGSLLCEKDRQELKKRISRCHKDSTSSDGHAVNRSISRVSHKSDTSCPKKDEPDWKVTDEKVKLIQKEKAEVGTVKPAVVMAYLRAVGLPISILVLIVYALNNAAGIAGNVWLSDWTDEAARNNGTITREQRDYRLGVYGSFAVIMGAMSLVSSFARAIGSIRASHLLHLDLLRNVLKLPMHFFDQTPVGRIVNRFSKDVDGLDLMIPLYVGMWLMCVFHVISTLLVISVSTPIFLVAVVPLAALYIFAQRFYVATSRQLKRLDGVTRSPIYSHFGETVVGVASIRAFGQQDRFIQQSDQKLDENQRTIYPTIMCNRWLAVRLDFVGNSVIFFAALFAILNRGTISPGIVGLSISYAFNVTQTLNWMVRMTSELESNIVAVERIKEYSETPTEAAWDIEDTRPNDAWPEQGQVTFSGYSTRYREGLDLVVKDIDCIINPGEKVGIVGRTGAGKSSLTLSLFRIIEPAHGSIIIDGVDISKIGLHNLRSKLTIIPQDPMLFAGTLRQNLDPFNESSDEKVWVALEYSHLKTFVSSLSQGLEYECTEGGENLSIGQRQLVCLARALLRRTKILVLDEATAAVDLETDDLIQKTIRTTFADCTVITIAHRLNTIMDYNRIMVLDAGRLVEYDSPQALLQKPQSLFYGMARDAGLLGSNANNNAATNNGATNNAATNNAATNDATNITPNDTASNAIDDITHS